MDDPVKSWVPSLIFIELTKSCEYTCRHCRASAQTEPLPDELDFQGVRKELDSISELGPQKPLVIFTGGNPLRRKDLFQILEYARQRGINFSISPPGSELITDNAIKNLKELGCRSISISLDGAGPKFHEWLRNMEGSFDLALNSIQTIRDNDMRVQINTTVMKENISELPGIAALLLNKNILTWELFFLINTGRGKELEPVNSKEALAISLWVLWLKRYGLDIRMVELPQHRVVQSKFHDMESLDAYIGQSISESTMDESLFLFKKLVSEFEVKIKDTLPEETIKSNHSNDHGRFSGILFIGYNGEVYPSGFLPVSVGNAAEKNLREIIDDSELLLKLRDRTEMKGICKKCTERVYCVGSRARAYALSGDPFEEDSTCFISTMKEKSRMGDDLNA